MAKLKQSAAAIEDDIEYFGDDEMIMFGVGAPGPEALAGCRHVVLKATEALMNDPSQEKYIFQYGPRPGDPGFLEDLAKFLSTEYGDHVSSDNLMVTAGATHGFYLAACILFGHDAPIFVEDPTYFMAINILRKDLGKTIIAVPSTDDGVDTERLEELLKEHREKAGDKKTWKCPFWTMFYTMTVYRNPTTDCVSPEKSRQIIELARKYDVLVFAEDVYNLVHYGEGRSPPRLLTYDVSDDPEYTGCVLSNGTFSKIFSPGMRLGWFEGHRGVLEHLITSYTVLGGGSPNHYTSRIMGTSLQLGLLQEHLKHVRILYGKRMNLKCEAMSKHLPTGCEFTQRKGGFFVWVKLPESIEGKRLLELAKDKYKINFIPGQSSSPENNFKNYIRLSISYCDTHRIEEGIDLLGKAIREYMASTH